MILKKCANKIVGKKLGVYLLVLLLALSSFLYTQIASASTVSNGDNVDTVLSSSGPSNSSHKGLSEPAKRLLDDVLSKKVNATALENIEQQMLEHKRLIESRKFQDPTRNVVTLDDPIESRFLNTVLDTPPHAHTIAWGGTAYLGDTHNIEWPHDNNYAELRTENYNGEGLGDEAFITGEMNWWSQGTVWLRCYSSISSVVFVVGSDSCDDAWGDWEWISDGTFIEPGMGVSWVNVGYAVNQFKYIAVCVWATSGGYDDNDVYIDSVCAGEIPPPSHQLTITSGPGGTTNPEPGQYYSNQQISVTALQYSGYVFDSWLLDGSYVSTVNPITIDMWGGDHTLEARFNPVSTLTVTTTSGGTTNPAPGQHQYDYGTGVTVYAIPDQGSSFSYWLLNGEYVYTDTSIYLSMTSSYSLEAHFNEALPTCQLTITAYDYTHYAQNILTNVWVDSQWVGTADLTVTVPLGTREVWADDPAYDYQWGYGPALYTLVDDQVYGGGAYAQFPVWQLHKTVTFVYIWQ